MFRCIRPWSHVMPTHRPAMHAMFFHNTRRLVQQRMQQLSGDWDVFSLLQHIYLTCIIVKKSGRRLFQNSLPTCLQCKADNVVSAFGAPNKIFWGPEIVVYIILYLFVFPTDLGQVLHATSLEEGIYCLPYKLRPSTPSQKYYPSVLSTEG